MTVATDYPATVRPLSAADGGGSAAYALDLPGCMSDGETLRRHLRTCKTPFPAGLRLLMRWGGQSQLLKPEEPQPMLKYG